MVFVMETKNAELEETLMESLECKFQKMLHDLKELRQIAIDANIEFCYLSTTTPCDYYNNHLQIGLFSSTTDVHVNAVQNGLTGKGVYLWALGMNEHFYDIQRCNSHVGINAVHSLIKNWNTVYEELQVEMCKEIQKRINLDIINSTDRYNKIQKQISDL